MNKKLNLGKIESALNDLQQEHKEIYQLLSLKNEPMTDEVIEGMLN
jgi:hypothetical protein